MWLFTLKVCQPQLQRIGQKQKGLDSGKWAERGTRGMLAPVGKDPDAKIHKAVISLTEKGKNWPWVVGALYAHLISQRDYFSGPHYTFSEKLSLYISNMATLSDICLFPFEVQIVKPLNCHTTAEIVKLLCIFNCMYCLWPRLFHFLPGKKKKN